MFNRCCPRKMGESAGATPGSLGNQMSNRSHPRKMGETGSPCKIGESSKDFIFKISFYRPLKMGDRILG